MHESDEWFGGYSTSATRDDITVEKGITIDDIPLPAIGLRLTSAADRPVAVRVVERVPATMPMENVAFHVDHGAADWRATEDNRLVWRRRVEPGETVETLFGIWLTEPREVFSFLKEPDIAAVRRLDGRGDAASWRYEGEETTAVDVIDDEFETAEPALLREMVADLREQLTGERVAIDTSLGTAVRGGERRLDAPTADGVAELHDSAGDLPEGDRCVVRVATEGGRHGGGGVAVLQELTNAVTVLSKRVRPQSGDGEVLDALVATDLAPDTLVDSLVDRAQVVGALVAPVGSGDRDAAETDAEEEANPDDEVPDDPMAEFASLQEEIDTVSTDQLERELEEVTLPGAEDREEEIGIDELLAEVGPMDDGGDEAAEDAPDDPLEEAVGEDEDLWGSEADEVGFDDLLAEAEGEDEDGAAEADDGEAAEAWSFGVDPVEPADGEATDADAAAEDSDVTATSDEADPTADAAASTDDADATPTEAGATTPEQATTDGGRGAVAADGTDAADESPASPAEPPEPGADTPGEEPPDAGSETADPGSTEADAGDSREPTITADEVDPSVVVELVEEVERLRARVADLEETEEEVERLRERVAELETRGDHKPLPGSPRLLEES